MRAEDKTNWSETRKWRKRRNRSTKKFIFRNGQNLTQNSPNERTKKLPGKIQKARAFRETKGRRNSKDNGDNFFFFGGEFYFPCFATRPLTKKKKKRRPPISGKGKFFEKLTTSQTCVISSTFDFFGESK